MPSLLIKNTKMPKMCKECPAYVCQRTWSGDCGDEFCGLTKSDIDPDKRAEDCPLIEVAIFVTDDNQVRVGNPQ